MSDWDSLNPPSAVSSESVRGGAAITVSRVGQQFLSFSVTIILARQLTPDEFGTVAVVVGVLALLLPFHDAGLSIATVQRAKLSVEAVSTLFWINAALGLVLTLAFAGLADPLADFLRRPELEGLCYALSLDFILNGLIAQHRALLQRSMRFGTRARIDLTAALIGGLSAIAMALAGLGIWALAAQLLVGDAVAMVMLVAAIRWKLTPPEITPEVRQMVTFGASFFGFNIVLAVANNLSIVLLGRRMGAGAVGFYTRAYALASVPQSLLQAAASYVATAKLSRAQEDPAAFADFYFRGVQLLTLVALPVVIGFAGFGEQIAPIVYGSQWGPVADLLPILAIGLAVVPLLDSTTPLFVARGHTRRMFHWAIFGAAVMMVGTVVGLQWGTKGLAVGWSASMLALLLPGLIYSAQGTDVTLRRLARAVGGIYAAAIGALGLAWFAHQFLAGLSAAAELLVGLSFSLIGYLALCYFAFGQKALINDVLRRLLRTPGKHRHDPPAWSIGER